MQCLLFPKEQQEFLKFIVEYAITLEQYQLNLNSVIHKGKWNEYKQLRLSELNKLRERLVKLEQEIKPEPRTPMRTFLNHLHLLLLRLKTEILILYQISSPAAYYQNVHDVFVKYHRDIETLILKTNEQLNLNKEVTFKEKKVLSSLLETLWSSWRLMIPISFERIYDARTSTHRMNNDTLYNLEKDVENRKIQIYFKWFTDRVVTLTLSTWLYAALHIPGQLIHSIPEMITSIRQDISLMTNVDFDPQNFQTRFQANYEKTKEDLDDSLFVDSPAYKEPTKE